MRRPGDPLIGNVNGIVEFSHRTLAGIVVILIGALVSLAFTGLRELRWPLRISVLAGVLVLGQAALGGLTVENNLEDELVAAHLCLAMLLLGLVLWLVAGLAPRREWTPGTGRWAESRKQKAESRQVPFRG